MRRRGWQISVCASEPPPDGRRGATTIRGGAEVSSLLSSVRRRQVMYDVYDDNRSASSRCDWTLHPHGYHIGEGPPSRLKLTLCWSEASRRARRRSRTGATPLSRWPAPTPPLDPTSALDDDFEFRAVDAGLMLRCTKVRTACSTWGDQSRCSREMLCDDELVSARY